MKKYTKLAAFVAIAMAASTAYADDAILNANNQVSLSGGASNLNYKEISRAEVPTTMNSETGTQAAIGISTSRQGSIFGIKDVYTSVSSSFAFGNTAYDGHLLDATFTPQKATSKNFTTDVQLRLGKAFRFGVRSQFQVVPFVQYGYHYWNRDAASLETEEYSHNAFGGGVLIQGAPTDKLVLSLDVAVSGMVGAQMKEVGFPAAQLESRPITQVGVGVDYAVTKHLHVNVNYKYSNYRYGISNSVTDATGRWSIYEPDSRTTQQLVMFGVGYSF
ncbi:outer membrane protein [Pararobbsia alpina]|uniref:Uncharacterized protein n=1 Tax=Pararobbsia alpina TaxID=621374 RepID=A0A6S7C3I7_9BURK|nr:outer membrane beta-barrel protein [Pararobbsia alpina]CAB3780223.1 hypothetical protein LMG28138_00993 [Pararobbsia alpina]